MVVGLVVREVTAGVFVVGLVFRGLDRVMAALQRLLRILVALLGALVAVRRRLMAVLVEVLVDIPGPRAVWPTHRRAVAAQVRRVFTAMAAWVARVVVLEATLLLRHMAQAAAARGAY